LLINTVVTHQCALFFQTAHGKIDVGRRSRQIVVVVVMGAERVEAKSSGAVDLDR
jgi:hypothetical protein